MLITDKTKWCWWCDENEFVSGPFETKEEAINDLKQEMKFYEDMNCYIGHPMYYKPIVSARDVIENIQMQAFNETDAYTYECEYLESVMDEDMIELEHMLTAVYQDWEKKHGYNFSGYIVNKDERIQ